MTTIKDELPQEHQLLTFHPKFNSPEGNAILISRDDTSYRVPSYVLCTSSQYLEDLLPKNLTKTLYFVVEAKDRTLERILGMISGFEMQPWDSFDELEETLLFAEKLRMPGPISVIRTAIGASLALGTFEPLRVYGLADHRNWEAEAKCASSKTLSLCLFDKAYEEQLMGMASASVVKLFRFHRHRRDEFKEKLDSAVLFKAGNVDTACSCGKNVDNLAWMVFKARMLNEMDLKPSGETLFTLDMEDWPEYIACWEARCASEFCRKLRYNKVNTLRNIQDVISELPTSIDS